MAPMEVAAWKLQVREFIDVSQLKAVNGVGWCTWVVTLLVVVTSTLAWYGGGPGRDNKREQIHTSNKNSVHMEFAYVQAKTNSPKVRMDHTQD